MNSLSVIVTLDQKIQIWIAVGSWLAGLGTIAAFDVVPNWARDFGTGFVQDLSDKYLKTLVVQIHTPLGHVETHPMPSVHSTNKDRFSKRVHFAQAQKQLKPL